MPLLLPFFPKVKATFADQVKQEQFVRQSDLDWTIVRPARLINEPAKGAYRVGDPLKIGLNSKIARADVADFLLKQLSNDTYLHQVARLKY